ncbi:MAG TPA: C40 family peptidase [Rhodocyclaceae bacterium]|jgi:cell wall-associated NlpC family hydrolase|nr:C40 family peptidase [Rhodocyclaceae bacterium]
MARPPLSLRLQLLLLSASVWLSACGLLPFQGNSGGSATISPGSGARLRSDNALSQGNDVVIFALGLVETGYRFGGKNPEAGLDCSGMVSYVFDKAAGLRLTGSAADLARKGKLVERAELQPGDVLFFNTSNRPHSHVGIYIGNGRFVHAPSSKGAVRTENLDKGWFASRFEEARTYLD